MCHSLVSFHLFLCILCYYFSGLSVYFLLLPHIFTTYHVFNVNTNPARAVIDTNQLPVVRQLSLNNHVLTCASCHLITCMCSLLTSYSDLAGCLLLLLWGLGDLMTSALESGGPGEIDECPSCSSDLLTSTGLPEWGPPHSCSLWGLYGVLRPQHWSGRWVICMQFWPLDLMGAGLKPPLVGRYLYHCHFQVLSGSLGPLPKG